MRAALAVAAALALAGCAGVRQDGSISFEGWSTGRATASGYAYTTTDGRRQKWAVGDQCRIDRSVPCLTSLPR